MLTKQDLFERIENAETKLVDVADIVFDKAKYSRKAGIDNNAVIDYSQNIIGMPPIVITDTGDGDKKFYIVNGVHRYKAVQKAEQKQIQAKIIQLPTEHIKFANLLCDIDTGVRHPTADKKSICIDYFDAFDVAKNQQIMAELGVPEATYYAWTADIRKQKQKEINEAIAGDLLNPMMEQQEIAERHGYKSKSKITDFKNNVSSKILNIREIELETLQEENLDFLEQYKVWVETKGNQMLFNIWNTPKATGDHFGHFPLVFMKNLLFYHTKPFDFVYDPFAGGGTTITACREMYRKFYCTDRKPVGHMKDIILQHDISDGFPDGLPKPDMVFLDPPYWKQAENKYSEDPEDLGNMTIEQFNDAMRGLLNLCASKKIEKIAIVIQPTQFKNDFVWQDHIFDFHDMLPRSKYEIEMRYILPYSTEQYNAQIVDKAKEKEKCLCLNRDLVVWRFKK